MNPKGADVEILQQRIESLENDLARERAVRERVEGQLAALRFAASKTADLAYDHGVDELEKALADTAQATAAHDEAVRKEERENAARVADETAKTWPEGDFRNSVCKQVAAAIRARTP